MSKIFIVLFAVSACMLATVSAGINRKLCYKSCADYLATAEIDSPVQTLVDVSRKIYPDVAKLIEDEIPVAEYEEALTKIGPQVGCGKLEEHVQKVGSVVPCCIRLERDENGLLDTVSMNEDAKKVIEAFFACIFSKSD